MLEKTEVASELMVFLGILLDGRNFLLTVPEEKRTKATSWLAKFIDSKKATVKELEKLAGLLNFLSRAIVPGTAFTRRMYTKFSNTGIMEKLKPYHHIRLGSEFKQDCQVWLQFLQLNIKNSVSRPYIDVFTPAETANQIMFHSDATANPNLGFEAIFEHTYLYNKWEPGFVLKENPNIEFLELYALCMGVFVWADRLRNRRVILYCDNSSVCGMVSNVTSGCKFCMTLVIKLTLKCLNYNIRIFAEHIKGRDNVLSDNLSRLKIDYVKHLAAKQGRIIDAI